MLATELNLRADSFAWQDLYWEIDAAFRLWMRIIKDQESRGRQLITLSRRAWTPEEFATAARNAC
jgi:hypothetical protein